MAKIVIVVSSCRQCPHFIITGVSSTDGWDRGEEWFCNKAKKKIAGFVEWHDSPAIPRWCPVSLKEDKDVKE